MELKPRITWRPKVFLSKVTLNDDMLSHRTSTGTHSARWRPNTSFTSPPRWTIVSIASTERCHPFRVSTADWLKMSIDAQVTNSKCQRTYCWWSTVIFYWRICCFRRLSQNSWHSCEIYPSAFRCRIYCLRRLFFNFSTINSHMLIVSNLWYLLTKNFNNLHCLNSFMHSAFIRFDERYYNKDLRFVNQNE